MCIDAAQIAWNNHVVPACIKLRSHLLLLRLYTAPEIANFACLWPLSPFRSTLAVLIFNFFWPSYLPVSFFSGHFQTGTGWGPRGVGISELVVQSMTPVVVFALDFSSCHHPPRRSLYRLRCTQAEMLSYTAIKSTGTRPASSKQHLTTDIDCASTG